jgi:hypothetical protein
MEYITKIQKIEISKDIIPDEIVQVSFSIIGTNGVNSECSNGIIKLKPVDINNYKKLNEINEDKLISWIHEHLGDDINFYKNDIQFKLNQKNKETYIPKWLDDGYKIYPDPVFKNIKK